MSCTPYNPYMPRFQAISGLYLLLQKTIRSTIRRLLAARRSQVTLIEQASHIMSREEDDAALIVQQAMQKDGVVIVLDAKVIRVEKDSSDRLVVVSRAGGEERVRGDQILVGIGRTPRIGLGKIASTIHPYPTQAEAVRKLGDQFNRTKLTPTVKSLF